MRDAAYFLGCLDRGYELVGRRSRLEFLTDEIFDFTVCDGSVSEVFATKAVEVCRAITKKQTFDYIGASQENYMWFLLMVNMPFFTDKLDWGTSIRGAWWSGPIDSPILYGSCGLVDEHGKQMAEPKPYPDNEWSELMTAVVTFSCVE